MSLQGLLNQTVRIYLRSAAFDRYGNAQFTTNAYDYPARVTRISKDILQPDGETVNLNLKVQLKGDVTVRNDDKLVYNGDNYKVISRKEAIRGDGSLHHLTLLLTGWIL